MRTTHNISSCYRTTNSQTSMIFFHNPVGDIQHTLRGGNEQLGSLNALNQLTRSQNELRHGSWLRGGQELRQGGRGLRRSRGEQTAHRVRRSRTWTACWKRAWWKEKVACQAHINRCGQTRPSNGVNAARQQTLTFKSDVWLTVHRNSVWIRKTN